MIEQPHSLLSVVLALVHSEFGLWLLSVDSGTPFGPLTGRATGAISGACGVVIVGCLLMSTAYY